MTRTEVRNYIAQIEKAIRDAGIKGISLTESSASFSDTDLKVKLEFRTTSNGVADTTKEENFLHSKFVLAGTSNIPIEIIGSKCFINGKAFTILGAKTSSPKNCVRLESANGAKYVCPIEVIKFAL